MTDRDDFLAWIMSTLYDAEVALHNGDADPRRALWSRNETVSILGALRDAHGLQEVEDTFRFLESSFTDCSSFRFELEAIDVVGDMAYTAGREHTSASWTGSRAATPCESRRCIAARTAHGGSLTDRPTPSPDETGVRMSPFRRGNTICLVGLM